MTTDTICIFTDAATSPQTGVAVGAFLCIDERCIANYAEFSMRMLSTELSDKVVYIEFVSNKSTWSEIKTAIHALDSVLKNAQADCRIEIYTDCQSICDLLGKRKEKLEKNKFMTRDGKLLPHANLYKELFALTEKLKVQIFKLKGHHPTSHHLTEQERIFSLLDKLTRQRLRSVTNK
jgi:ribonuclease HI